MTTTLLIEVTKTIVIQDAVQTGRQARMLRESIPLTLREASVRVGLSEAQLSRLERGHQSWDHLWIDSYNQMLTANDPPEYRRLLEMMLGGVKLKGSRNILKVNPGTTEYYNLLDMERMGLVTCANDRPHTGMEVCFYATRKGCCWIGLNNTEIKRAMEHL